MPVLVSITPSQLSKSVGGTVTVSGTFDVASGALCALLIFDSSSGGFSKVSQYIQATGVTATSLLCPIPAVTTGIRYKLAVANLAHSISVASATLDLYAELTPSLTWNDALTGIDVVFSTATNMGGLAAVGEVNCASVR